MHPHKKRMILFILFLVTFLDWVGFGLVYPMFSAMLFEDGYLLSSASDSDLRRGIYLGILLSAMPIAQFFFSPMVGALSDQKGRRPLMQITLILTVAGYLFSFFAAQSRHLVGLILSRVAIGIGAGNVAVISASLADISTENEKVKNFGLLHMACGIGFTLGPYLGGKFSTINSLGGFAAPFLLAAVVGLLSLILVQIYFKEPNQNLRNCQISFFKGAKNFVKAFSNNNLKILFGCVFLFCFGWSFFWEFIPIFLIKEYKIAPSQVGTLYAYAAIFYALSCGCFLRPVSKYVKPPILYVTGLAGLSLCIGILLFDSSYSRVWLYIPLQQILLSFIFPTASAMVSSEVKDNSQGETLGILASVNSCAFAFSPLISGFIVGTSHWSPIWAGSISLLVAAALFFFGFIRKKSPSEPILEPTELEKNS
ncbi:MAG: MFS transporter [Chlamydiae bacterium]|nr:MFS transporter [Chlamydiota bacterium]